MVVITPDHLKQLIAIEALVHYAIPPPSGQAPFIAIQRDSSVLLSAPHGARTFRNTADETWHEEDEYTAGLALLLSDLCGTSVIATVWRSDDSDPNYHREAHSSFKQSLREMMQSMGVRWVIDLHGAKWNTSKMETNQWIDLGTRRELISLPTKYLQQFEKLLEDKLGKGVVHHNGYPAREESRTITAFVHGELLQQAVQVEMKPIIRVPLRRTDASRYTSDGPYTAPVENVIGLMQALVDFIRYIKTGGE